jgi:hypothetical protein
MPREDELPDDLKGLARRQALELRHTRFAADVDAIVSALKASLPGRTRRWVWVPLAATACLIAAFCSWFFLIGPGPESSMPNPAASSVTNQLTVEPDTDRGGGDYHSFELSQPRFEACRSACAEAPECRAYTYVKPGVQGGNARCWLKSVVPAAYANPCCISGIKVE